MAKKKEREKEMTILDLNLGNWEDMQGEVK